MSALGPVRPRQRGGIYKFALLLVARLLRRRVAQWLRLRSESSSDKNDNSAQAGGLEIVGRVLSRRPNFCVIKPLIGGESLSSAGLY